MKRPSTMAMLFAMGTVTACAGGSDDQVGHTPRGETIPTSSVDMARSYALPVGARLVADAVNQRFLVVTSNAQDAYALDRAVSCACKTTCAPVALGSAIGCTFGADLRITGYEYRPLQGPAAAETDTRIVETPEVAISASKNSVSLDCGTQAPDFEMVLSRFARDMSARGSTRSGDTTLVLNYKTGTAIWMAFRGVFPEYDDTIDGIANNQIPSVPTCTCNTGNSGCTLVDKTGQPYYCDAGSCTSCSIARDSAR